jgi:hypothetical protein
MKIHLNGGDCNIILEVPPMLPYGTATATEHRIVISTLLYCTVLKESKQIILIEDSSRRETILVV